MTDRPVATSRRRRPLVVVATPAALAVAATLVLLVGLREHGGAGRAPTGPRVSAAEAARYRAVDHLLQARSTAIVHRDRVAFLATVDPQATSFRRIQGRMFAHLAPVPLASWSYSFTAAARKPPPDAARYGAPVWSPSYFVVHYRIGGFDEKPTTLQQYPTFVERDGRWYLGSLSDYAPRRLVSATDIWDYGPVKVLRRPHVLVLGAPSELTTMTEVATQVVPAIGQVTAVWGNGWAQRVVVLVPSTTREMSLIADYRGDLHNIAALTSAEVSSSAGHPTPVGDRITINPVNWPLLSDIGAAVVIRHELTHVATRAVTGTQTPTWLSEGFADYVGFLDAHVSVHLAGAALQRSVRAGQVPAALPSNRDFRGSNPDLAAHYEAAWLACRYIADRFGQSTLVRFYRAVGTSTQRPRVALQSAMRDLLDMSLTQFVVRWRHYMAAELG